MKSSKDMADKANALLNTAAAAQIPAALDEPSQGEASRDSLLCRRANLSRLCGPGLASAPVTHLTSSAHPGGLFVPALAGSVFPQKGGEEKRLFPRGAPIPARHKSN